MTPMRIRFKVWDLRVAELPKTVVFLLSFYYSITLRNYCSYRFYYRSKETTVQMQPDPRPSKP